MVYSWDCYLDGMEAKGPAMNVLQQMDIAQAIHDLQIPNQVFEERFISFGDALA